jgi:Predicted metal-dependent hydrolase with the TIM-barrel fold
VLTNAHIYTGNPAQPEASSMAVTGSRIVAVGKDASAYLGPRTKTLDLGGAAVVPGLIDSHAHMAALGDMLETFDLRDVKTIAASPPS